jgi:uncharacterized protein YerC
MFWNKNRANTISALLSQMGQTIGRFLEHEERRNESKRQMIIDLIRRTHSFDDLNDVIERYGDDDSVSVTLALMLQAIDIRFKDTEYQIQKLALRSDVMEEHITDLDKHMSAVVVASQLAKDSTRPRGLRWTAKQKEIRSMLNRGMSFTEIVNSGQSKATVSRVKTALQRERARAEEYPK